MRKGGQVTIIIILAIVIVAAILAIGIVASRAIKAEIPNTQMPNPSEFISKCANDEVLNVTGKMMPSGGYLNPTNFKDYEGKRVAYLCYYSNYYSPCINQEPDYLGHLETEIKTGITPRLNSCFNLLKKNYIDAGYETELGSETEMKVAINLKPKKIEIELERKLVVSRGNNTIRFEKLDSSINSPLYELARAAMWITSSESRFCYFEPLGYSIFPGYDEVSMDRVKLGDGTKIYSIKDRISGKELKIAIRSCVSPPGRF